MNKVRNFFTIGLLLVVAVFGLYGCGGSDPTATPPPPTAAPTDTVAPATPTSEAATATVASTGTGDTGGAMGGALSGPVGDLLNKSQAAMKKVTSFHFTMDVQADAAGSQTFKGEGDYMAPDKVRFTMSGLMAPGAPGITDTVGSSMPDIEMVMVGSETYMKQPGSEQYMSLGALGGASGLAGFTNPAETSSITQFADSAEIVGDEKVDGVDTTHITFTYDADKAMMDTAQQMGTPLAATTPTGVKSKGDIWIEKSTSYIHKMTIVSKAPASGMQANPVASGDSTVTIVYSKHNEPVSPPIEKPTNIVTIPGNVGTPVP